MKNEYRFSDCGQYVYILLTGKGYQKETKISAEDFDLANSITGTWYAKKHSKTHSFYAMTSLNPNKEYPHLPVKKGTNTYYLHQLILQPKDGNICDHKTRDTLDNSRENLREVDYTENAQNRSIHDPKNATGVRGLYWGHREQKYIGRITLPCGRRKVVVRTDDKKEAILALIKARKKHYPAYYEDGLDEIVKSILSNKAYK